MSIIHLKNAGYDRYEGLLFRRDQYQKEADISLSLYIREFGEQIRQNFEKMVECIRLRKCISIAQAELNRGGRISITQLLQTVEQQMQQYYQELERMADRNEVCQRMKTLPEQTVLQVKKLYRELAKLIHPDLNPQTVKSQKLQELWNRISAAYKTNNLKELQNLQILVSRVMLENGMDGMEVEIPDMEERIKELEAEIQKIVTTDPYQYRFLLEDEQAVEEKHHSLKHEAAEHEEARKQLQELLDDLLKKGGAKWKIN